MALGKSRLALVVSDDEGRGAGGEVAPGSEIDRALARGDFATVRRMGPEPDIAAMVAPERAFLVVGIICVLVISALFGYYVIAT